jgi:hypothetical protein
MKFNFGRRSAGVFLLFSLSTIAISAAQAENGPGSAPSANSTPNSTPIDLNQLLHRVEEHQKQVETLREDYTYDCVQMNQEFDSNGQVKKTETEKREEFFVNGHMIGRVVERDGQPLSQSDRQKEDQRIAELVTKAQKTPPDERLEGPNITVGRVLELMDLRNPRREMFRGRPTIVFDFVGRKDMKTHGMMEDASKKLRGTVWIDEADLQVAHLEVTVDDNFHIAGGLLASVEKGSSFRFDQARVNAGLWLPAGSEANMQARVLLVKNLHEHLVQHNSGFRRFSVEAAGVQHASQTRP